MPLIIDTHSIECDIVIVPSTTHGENLGKLSIERRQEGQHKVLWEALPRVRRNRTICCQRQLHRLRRKALTEVPQEGQGPD